MKGPRTEKIRSLFDSIAKDYDRLNHILSLGVDRLWRKRALKWINDGNPEKKVLDIACGTGDFSIEIARHSGPETTVCGIDLSEGMLEVMRRKVSEAGLEGRISAGQGNCEAMPFEDDSFDRATIAFGIRNFQDLEAGLREMHRVLKKDGMLCVIELTRPVHFPIKQLFTIYTHTILPVYGRLISKDKSAYRYLIATIEAFPQGETMVEILKRTGFAKASFKRLTFGICTCYTATK